MKTTITGGKVNLGNSNTNNSDSLLDSDPIFPNFSEESRNQSTNAKDAHTVSSDSAALIDDVPAVWCLDCQENLVFLGTGSGRLEIWDALNGSLKVHPTI